MPPGQAAAPSGARSVDSDFTLHVRKAPAPTAGAWLSPEANTTSVRMGQRTRARQRSCMPFAATEPSRESATQKLSPIVQRNNYPPRRTQMIGDLFDSPWKILIVALVIIVLFGSRKLPHAARSLGQSMRILKTEVQGLHEDSPPLRPPRPLGCSGCSGRAGELQQQTVTATGTAPADTGRLADSRSPGDGLNGHGEDARRCPRRPDRRGALRANATAAEPRGADAPHGSPPGAA